MKTSIEITGIPTNISESTVRGWLASPKMQQGGISLTWGYYAAPLTVELWLCGGARRFSSWTGFMPPVQPRASLSFSSVLRAFAGGRAMVGGYLCSESTIDHHMSDAEILSALENGAVAAESIRPRLPARIVLPRD